MMDVSVNRENGHHYLVCPLGRYPRWREISPIKEYLIKHGAKRCKRTSHEMHFRYPLGGEQSLHITISRSAKGFSVNAHIDVIPHEVAVYDDTTYLLLRELDKLFSETFGRSVVVKENAKKNKPHGSVHSRGNLPSQAEHHRTIHEVNPRLPYYRAKRKKKPRNPRDKIISYMYSPRTSQSDLSNSPQDQKTQPAHLPECIPPLTVQLKKMVAEKKDDLIREAKSSIGSLSLKQIPKISTLKKRVKEQKNTYLSLKEKKVRKGIKKAIFAYLDHAYPQHRGDEHLVEILRGRVIHPVHEMVLNFREEIKQLYTDHRGRILEEYKIQSHQEQLRKEREVEWREERAKDLKETEESRLLVVTSRKEIQRLRSKKRLLYLCLLLAAFCILGLFYTWPFGKKVNFADGNFYDFEVEAVCLGVLFVICVIGASGSLALFFGRSSRVSRTMHEYEAQYRAAEERIERGRIRWGS